MKNIYHKNKAGEVFIGEYLIDTKTAEMLKDQAHYIKTSQLWEIISNTVTAEANRMALNESSNWEHVLSAKQLFYWHKIMQDIVETLAKYKTK